MILLGLLLAPSSDGTFHDLPSWQRVEEHLNLARCLCCVPVPTRFSCKNDSAWIWSFGWTLNHISDLNQARSLSKLTPATATALTVGLWTLYPRGKMLFATLCLGTLMQRIYCGSHFLSDLCGSAAIGLWWSYVCYHPRLMGSMFEKLESDYDTKAKRKIPPASLNPESDPPDLLNRFNIQADGNKRSIVFTSDWSGAAG